VLAGGYWRHQHRQLLLTLTGACGFGLMGIAGIVSSISTDEAMSLAAAAVTLGFVWLAIWKSDRPAARHTRNA
jgi:hypothetical protein